MPTRGCHWPVHACLALGAAATLLAAELRAQGTDPPNIVVVMADDLDVASLEEMIGLELMPHFTRLFRDEGVRFTNTFVTNSLCCPSRATFLTGQYSHNHGVLSNFSPIGGAVSFKDGSTLATWLDERGYRTGYVGKYLNGYGLADVNHDGERDYQDSIYVPPGWDDWQTLLDPFTYRVYNYVINDNGTLVRHGTSESDYQTDVLARRAADFISESDSIDDEAPFFLAVMPLAPHVEVFLGASIDTRSDVWRWSIRPAPRHDRTVKAFPPILPSFNESDVSDKPVWLQAWPRLTALDYLYLVRQYQDRLESLRAVDDLLGHIVAELERNQELERTVILFTSDNGLLHGEHRLPEKQYPYEEAIRVPLAIRVPGVPGGRTVDAFVLNNDLAPTITELAGATPGLSMDGRSFLPLLADPAPSTWRQAFLVEHWADRNPLFSIPTYAGLRTGPGVALVPNLLYVEYEDGAQTPEMYDLRWDPFQLRSVHEQQSSRRVQQKEVLSPWLEQLRHCGEGTCQSLEFQ